MTLPKIKFTIKLPSQPFHLLSESPWPLYVGITSYRAFSSIIQITHNLENTEFFVSLTLLRLLSTLWWRDVHRERIRGEHSSECKINFKLGIVFFIISEICFFFSFFWTFFHIKLNSEITNGLFFPPSFIKIIDPISIPLLNTLILLFSGVTITWSHFSLLKKKNSECKHTLILTIFLALYFLSTQFIEYSWTDFTSSDSVYGSCFFTATGFHGIHVFIGITFLSVVLTRLLFLKYQRNSHFIFTAAAWYWHFVDVVWILLFFLVYI